MNIRILDGRLVKDAEVKKTKKGEKYLSFTLANNGFDKGEQVTTYFNVASYNPFDIQKHETEQSYKKGRLVVVSGRPKEELSTKDNKTYLNRYIMANSIEFGAYGKDTTATNTTTTTTTPNVVPVSPSCEVPTPTVTVPNPTVTPPVPQYNNDEIDASELPF